MKDILGMLATLRRPRLLIRAARIGAQDYRRDHLRSLLGYEALPRSGPALVRLIEMEASLEDNRREADARYSVARHVQVLVAMMGEARILRAAQPG